MRNDSGSWRISAPVMIWMSGTDRLCTWFNKSWLEFVGRPMEKEMRDGWLENVHPDDRERCVQTYTTAFDARRSFTMEYRCRRHDGEYRWLLDNGIPLTQGDAFMGYIGSCVDITPRKQVEQSLKESEERLRAILITAADAIITIDPNGIIQSVNPATERLFGYASAEMIGQNVKMLMPSPYHEEHDGYLARYFKTGEKRIIGIGREVEARRKDGSLFPVGLAVSEIKHLGFYTGILHDITKRKQLEREVVEISSMEQRRLGHDLHDTVAQELTALNILAKDLKDSLTNDSAAATKLAERIAQGVQRSQEELRAVLHGLIPVAVETEGLMAALHDLAERTGKNGTVNCTFDCPEPVEIADNMVATHLYLIAQEAVYNAVNHAKPRNIRIGLEHDQRLILACATTASAFHPSRRSFRDSVCGSCTIALRSSTPP